MVDPSETLAAFRTQVLFWEKNRVYNIYQVIQSDLFGMVKWPF